MTDFKERARRLVRERYPHSFNSRMNTPFAERIEAELCAVAAEAEQRGFAACQAAAETILLTRLDEEQRKQELEAGNKHLVAICAARKGMIDTFLLAIRSLKLGDTNPREGCVKEDGIKQARDELREPMSCGHAKANLAHFHYAGGPEGVGGRECYCATKEGVDEFCSVCHELAQARKEQMEEDYLEARGGQTGTEHDKRFQQKGLSQMYWKGRSDAATEIRTRFEAKKLG